MVKGNSRQVIVVHSPEQKLFEQAIFILKEDALEKGGVTDDALLKEARQLISSSRPRTPGFRAGRMLWTLLGAGGMGLAWLLTAIW